MSEALLVREGGAVPASDTPPVDHGRAASKHSRAQRMFASSSAGFSHEPAMFSTYFASRLPAGE